MARRYHIDELLWLRSSPLATKPTGLPPVEEWMGPIPEQTTQRKSSTNTRDPNNPDGTTSNRRPSFFEARHISRGSNSEDIILGPPKTAFASASRISGKGSIDSTERSARPGNEPEGDRFNFRDKFFKDRDAAEKDFDRRDGRPGTFPNRRGGDREDWNSGRPRRTFPGPEDQDRRPKRNGEFDRWENRDQPRDRDRDPRGLNRDRDRDQNAKDGDGRGFLRKDGQPARARHEGSWFRDDNVHTQDGAADHEEDKSSVRNREWRRDRHGADREWNRGAKFEQDPEWMDTNDRDESRRVHTQEDFERWKERMKAGSAPNQVEEKKESPVESATSYKAEPRPTDGEIFSNSTPFQGDTAMERFFGLLGDAKPSPQEVRASTPTVTTAAAAAAAATTTTMTEPMVKKEAASMKSSRFAGLFSPPPESPARDSYSPVGVKSPPPVANAPPSSDADQQGFQRILQMLGGGGGKSPRNATPHNDGTQPNRPPSLTHIEQFRGVPLSSPSKEPLHRPEYPVMQESPVRTMGPALQENIAAHDPHAREREHLLRLMQQVKVSPGANPAQVPHGQPHSAGPGPPPGLMNMPEAMPPPPPGIPIAQKGGPNFLDDPAISNMQRPDAEHLRRRPGANGPPPPPPPMGYFDDVPFPQGNQVPITPGGSRAPPGQGPGHPAMGMPRPPGFEHMPPPGWAGHQLPPQQGGGISPLGPPPGIPTPSRGMNPNFMTNAMPPMHGNMPPPPNERQPFPRGPPPGMMPPPGYMNGPPPPPSGFPPMPPNAEALMALGHVAPGPGPYGGNPGLSPQGPPPSSRHLLDMFGQASPGDARGGMIGPGQFR